MCSIPRTIVLDKSEKQLVLWPIKEVETVRENRVDVDLSFKETEFKKAEELDATWTNPQIRCSRKGANVEGGLGLYGFLTLASDDLEEYTAAFFKIFKVTDKYVVLMCSDQSRSKPRRHLGNSSHRIPLKYQKLCMWSSLVMRRYNCPRLESSYGNWLTTKREGRLLFVLRNGRNNFSIGRMEDGSLHGDRLKHRESA
ncbi:fructan 6-exohydrolase-like [Silene latifolia]|uniref:fructan 6-exohydrolase-like n=1 Tax=Silene latifolia TaxID=37657 RepID=UPI003D785DDB